ncbi:hypothetical protein FACS1894105_12180 [Clostridia bacterium]|nr:hypothetical protein FACS1894105_12180 [Clostridia bacterium]
MAKATMTMPTDFLLKLSKLGERTDEIIPEVVQAGGEVVLSAVKDNLAATIGSGTKTPSKSTGQLVDALGLSPAKQDRAGNWNIKVGFSENRSDGKSNAMIANIIEYGKVNQPPRPFLKPAKTKSKAACIEAMKQKFESEAGL